MKTVWYILISIITACLFFLIGVPTIVYVLLAVPQLQDCLKVIAEREVSQLLGADLSVERVHIRPFDRLGLEGACLTLEGDTIATLENIEAGIALRPLFEKGDIEITYALLEGPDVRLWRADKNAPLNIQPIIDRLKKKDDNKEPSRVKIKLNTLILRDGNFRYDILSAPATSAGRFDASHIALRDINLNVEAPTLGANGYDIDIEKLSFRERSGFQLSKLNAAVQLTDSSLAVNRLALNLPKTQIAIKPVCFTFSHIKELGNLFKTGNMEFATIGNAKIYLPDAKAFVPFFEKFDRVFALNACVGGNIRQLNIKHLSLADDQGGALKLDVKGSVSNLDRIKLLEYDIKSMELAVDGNEVLQIIPLLIPEDIKTYIRRSPLLNMKMEGSGSLDEGFAKLACKGSPGFLNATADYRRQGGEWLINAKLGTDSLSIGKLAGIVELGVFKGSVEGIVKLGSVQESDVVADIERLDVHGYSYKDLNISFKNKGAALLEADVRLNDPNAEIMAYALSVNDKGERNIQATANIAKLNLSTLGIDNEHKDYTMHGKLNVNANGRNVDEMTVDAHIFDLQCKNKSLEGFGINRIDITADPHAQNPHIDISSDILTGSISGPYSISSFSSQLQKMLCHFVPALFADAKIAPGGNANDFKFDFELKPFTDISEFFKIPFDVLAPAQINGYFNSEKGKAEANIRAPYIRYGKRLYENTDIYAVLDTLTTDSKVYMSTQFEGNKDKMVVAGLVTAANNRIDTNADWSVEGAAPMHGSIDFSTLFRSPIGKKDNEVFPLDALIEINPGSLDLAGSLWHIGRSTIDITPNKISIDDFELKTTNQLIAIKGNVGPNKGDDLFIKLDKFQLLPLFEMLNIPCVLIGGTASGEFTARNLLGGKPLLECESLNVEKISYNRCVLGDADILAEWSNEIQAFTLDAAVAGVYGYPTHIDAKIFPKYGIDLQFNVKKAPAGFLAPFFSSFASSVEGYANGYCRIKGPFDKIGIEGEVLAEDFKMHIDFINTSLVLTDSVHMRPGIMVMDAAQVKDMEGHTATFKGYLKHDHFRDMSYRFDITDAKNLLCFNVPQAKNPQWFGKVYGDGNVSIEGAPGYTDINVDMTSAPNSSFTLSLATRMNAADYGFLTFRDATPDSLKIKKPDSNIPEAVQAFRRKAEDKKVSMNSEINVDMKLDVKKDAEINIITSAVSGDNIRAHGDGSIHLAYGSKNNDLKVWGGYTVNDGIFRFTLQDILIRDFNIKEGSTLKFDGDINSISTQLQAYYATNANLTDLDESFHMDNELARTNVPVHALMKVTGPVTNPGIDFDLEFPTLTEDTYRKVRSIVSTSDMMNRQIIYLLGLNRFYTPEYMSNTSRGGELFSVASSTLSSQLGSMLGKLSDKWSIAPNLRSDRGDFSDLEVDVDLSARLLNNRLLLNGNFGYRDKLMNTNQFVGDFDVEYLLNKRGNWRVKAYNRYNDRSYYLRSALTTQGLGIMFRMDFDNLAPKEVIKEVKGK